MIKYKCLSCTKDYSKKLDGELKKTFKNTIKFSNNDINKFILFLRKVVYHYEYMDDREKFNGTTLPKKEEFVDVEEITYEDYKHGNRKIR